MAEIVDFGLQQHKIKMDSRYFENVLSVVAGDTGRRIEVQLLDTNGMVQDTTGLNLRLNAVIAGKATFTDATLVDAATGKYQLDLSNGMFLAPGNWQFQWQITDSAGKKLHSFAFAGNVGKNISEGGSQATNFYLNLEDLKAMQEDLVNGTFNSEALETNIAEKLEVLEETYAPRLTEVTAQLAQTATKAEVFLKSKGININDLDEPTRQAFLEAQGIDVNYILGEGNVKLENLAITKKSTNLYDENRKKSGVRIDTVTGADVVDPSYDSSDYIPVESGSQYYIRKLRYLVYYDANKVRVSHDGISAREHYVATVPANAKYMRISWALSYFPGVLQQVNKGSVMLPYENWYEYISKDYTEKHQIELSDLPDIPIEKMDFVELGSNLFNPSEVEEGKTLSSTTGGVSDAEGWYTSGYIDVSVADDYFIKHARRAAFYDASNTFISGLTFENPFNDLAIKPPTNAVTMRFTWFGSFSVSEQMVNKGTKALPFEKYGYHIMPDFIPTATDGSGGILILPSKVFALVGQELNIYFDTIFNDKIEEYDFDVTCSVGAHFSEYYRVNPTVEGSYPLSIKVSQGGKEVATASTQLIVSAANVGSGVNRDGVIIGDSTTAGTGMITKLHENFNSDPMNITTYGTRGTSPMNHEGRSGWTARQYVTVAADHIVPDLINAFWNPNTSKFDFSYWMDTYGYPDLDFVIINLGINDVFSYTDDVSLQERINEFISQYQEMIASIHAYDPSIRIGVALTIPPAYSQDSFATSYSNGQTRWRYKRNNFKLVQALIETFDGKEAQNIHLVPINVNLDTKHNFPFHYDTPKVPVNARNSEILTDYYAPNAGVHPALSGYWQIADVYWYWLKSFEV